MKHLSSTRLLGTIFGVMSLFSSGCATMCCGSTEKLHVQAIDQETQQSLKVAHITVTDYRGAASSTDNNPGELIVTRGRGKLDVAVSAPHYRQTSVGVGQSFNKWAIANVLFWPGILVDAYTGAIEKYPDHITVLMQKTPDDI